MIFSLWLYKTNPICRLCIKSWLKLYSDVVIYVDLQDYDDFFNDIEVELRDYKDILNIPIKNLLQFTDYFRFKRLLEQGGTWLDADMYLLRELPQNDIIISTERTNQSGAYKNSIKEIANIGVLRFPIDDPLLQHVVSKIETSKSKSEKIQKNMFLFQKAIHKNPTFAEYQNHLFDAEVFCPINWDCVKETYYNSPTHPFKSKYDKEITSTQDILDKSIGVHLWENLSLNKHQIDFKNIHPLSTFQKLKDRLEDTYIKDTYTICIPSYRRKELLHSSTLNLLFNNKIKKEIIVFLKDDKDLTDYRDYFKDYPFLKFVKTDVKGIGLTRTFIRKYFPIGTKILQIDDDILDIKSKREEFVLKDFFEELFHTMEVEDTKFAGCCPYDNEFYMKQGYTTNLKYTGGHLIAEIIRENPIEVNEEHFEDYIANIEYFKLDKKLIRFNDVYVKTKYYNPKGGIVESYGSLEQRKLDAEKLSKELEVKYKGYCKSYFKKKFQVYNLKLNPYSKT